MPKLEQLAKEIPAQKTAEEHWRALEREGYSPLLVHSVLVIGFGLDGSRPRIGERYIGITEFFGRINRVIPTQMDDARELYNSLCDQGIITEKKRGEVTRLDPHWQESAEGAVRDYISYALKERMQSGRLMRPLE